MIQVCSRCGTRWNVRDRQRVWCPRCQGTLLAPTAPAPTREWAVRPNPAQSGAPGPPHRLPPGYRWIAVRPGEAPPPRRIRRPLGPTPRYAFVPRWGLQEQFGAPAPTETVARAGSSPRMVRATLLTTIIVLGVAVLVHLVRYALLLVNRTTLLNPIVASVATWTGVAASVLAYFTLIAGTVVLINWLIARRTAAYAVHGTADPRPAWQLWLGCLVPLVNLFWAPVFVMELARAEGRLAWLRGIIVTWWCAWWVSFLVSVFSIVTSFATDVQGIANNTVATTIAYLAALAALLLTLLVYRGFEGQVTVDRSVKRWVIVPDESSEQPESPVPVESERDEPAA